MVEGQQLGAYRLLQRIGEGGMGVVFLAEHAMLGRRAAIKVLHPTYSMQPEIVQRFFNEARAATAISDPGIVQIFDFGQHTDGSAYIVMELLDGEALDRRLSRQGTMYVAEVLVIVRQVAASLAAAHARGIIHRDLKPENIFLVRDAEVPGGQRAKILDFGIAKLSGVDGSKTSTSAVMGTPMYMSPEQCRGAGQVDPRSDIYSLGCVLVTLLTGRPPFEAEGAGELIAMHLREMPMPPSLRVPSIPASVDALVMRCLAKDPNARYASANDLAAAIGSLLTQPAIANVATMPQQGHHASPTTLSSAAGVGGTQTTQPTQPTKGRGMLYAVVGLVVVGGGATAIAVSQSGGKPETTVTATLPPPPVVAPPPAPAPTPPPAPVAPPKVDARGAVAAQLATGLATFVTWSKTHADAPCPSATELGLAVDAWGHPLVVTCTDQPAHQIVGIVSSGADGQADTADDVASWTLDRAVTDSVRGAHWAPKKVATKPTMTMTKPPVATTKPAVTTAKPTTTTKPTTTGVPGDLDGDGIPDNR